MLWRLQAEEQLAALNAASFPYMERADARTYSRQLEDATGRNAAPRKATRADLQSLGINVITPEGSTA